MRYERPFRPVTVSVFALGLGLIALGLAAGASGAAPKAASPGSGNPAESKACLACHAEKTPGIVEQWKASGHAAKGVGCYDCHKAEDGDADAFPHNGKRIATIVSPKDCARCHQGIADQFQASHHAQAAKFIGSLDNVLGEIIEGAPAAMSGCRQCHGSEVGFLKNADGSLKKDDKGKPAFDPATWPNTGMGRINPDGSKGACSACHSRHEFSRALARQPDNCGKCHMGPDHPQIEIYNESKHGIAFRANVDRMNLSSKSWIVGKDYSVAPTCATCHMSATRTQKATHDVGERIAWTLRPVISTKFENADKRRANMQDVCIACHAPDFTGNFFTQFDRTVEHWNDKFARPAQAIMNALTANGLLTKAPFDAQIKWTFYELWHHEGRRARHGASMQGPDYTQWHGFYEVAKHFYFKFLPEATELGKGNATVEAEIQKVLDRPDNAWKKGMNPEVQKQVMDFYKERYGQ